MKTAVKWGVILGVAVIVWTLVIHALGFYTTRMDLGQKADVASLVLPVAAIVLALLERRRTLARPLTVKESLATGVVVGLVSAPITATFFWVYHHYVNPEWLEILVRWNRDTMQAAGKSAAEIATVETRLRSSGTDLAQIRGAFVGSTLFSFVVAGVASLFMRRPYRATPLASP
jgi:hypothetical protein